MGNFPLEFNSRTYTDTDFVYQRGYQYVYPDLLSDVPPTFDLMTSNGVSSPGMWMDIIRKTVFPEPTELTMTASKFKAFFSGQMLLFRDFTNKNRFGQQENQFYLRVKSYDPETGTLSGRIEGMQAPRSADEWVVTVAGSEVAYNAAKVMPFSVGGTGANNTLGARNAVFGNSLIYTMVEVFEDFTGFGGFSTWAQLSSQLFKITQSAGSVTLNGEGPVATLGTNWVGVAPMTITSGATDIAGVLLRNNVGSDYFGLVNVESTDTIEMISRIYIPALGAGGNDYRLHFGLFRGNAVLTGDPGAAGGFTLNYKFANNSGRWVARSGGNSVTTTNTATAPVVGWNILRLLYDPATGNLTFYQNGALIGTVAMSPVNQIFTGSGGQDFNNALMPGVLVYSDATNTSTKTFYVDYVFLRARILR